MVSDVNVVADFTKGDVFKAQKFMFGSLLAQPKNMDLILDGFRYIWIYTCVYINILDPYALNSD